MGLATIPSLDAIASQTGGTVAADAGPPVCSYRLSRGTSAIRVSVILPAIDETASLRRTVDLLLAENAPDLAEIPIITCRRTSQATLAVYQDLVREHPPLIWNRTEGISHNRRLQHFAYFRIGFKTRFCSRDALLARADS